MTFPFNPADYVFTREAIRALDQQAMEHYDIPGMVLMENASRGLAEHLIDFAEARRPEDPSHFLFICGGGNNGGDGFAAARHLHNRGHHVSILTMKARPQYQGDAAVNLRIAEEMGLSLFDGLEHFESSIEAIQGVDFIVDAYLGTGFQGSLHEEAQSTVAWMNELGKAIIAVDIPSGLDADQGLPQPIAVKASLTITFAGMKQAFLIPEAKIYTGPVAVVDIGAPKELIMKLGQHIQSL